jgi:hypothetical protein
MHDRTKELMQNANANANANAKELVKKGQQCLKKAFNVVPYNDK